MPFPQQPEHLFTKEGIEWLAAGQTGCYGLYRQGQWIYVGKSDDFRRRMLEHFNGDNPCIIRARPTHYVTVLVNPPDAWEQALIAELRPICNQRVG